MLTAAHTTLTMNLWLLCWQGAFIQLIFKVSVEAYGSGAPVEVCADPVPRHDSISQTSIPPFTIIPSQNNYAVNSIISVIISGSSNIKGFMLGAKRVKGDTEELLGTWTSCSTNVIKYSWPTIEFGQDNCVTHAEVVNKNSITCEWRAPSINVGDVFFRAAIVVLKSTFWLNIKSSIVTAPSSLVANSSYTTEYFGSASIRGCGSSVGCILYPAGCHLQSNCEAFATFSKVSDNLDVTIQAQATGYVSLAFSMDRQMGDDETFTCALNPDNDQIEVQRGYNDGYFNSRIRYTVLRQLEGKFSNGYITCRFVMPLSTSIAINGRILNFDRSSNSFFAFLAIGDVWPGTSAVNKHQLSPFRSLMSVDFTSTRIYSLSTFPILIQFHTFLMILMWYGLGAPASHIPAHLRTNLGVKPVWRSWIRLHMVTFVIAVSCGIVGVICALVHRGGIAQAALAHAILGLIVMSLLVAQIIMGFSRPSPDAKKRYIYNILHLVNGLIIAILGSVCVHIGFNLSLIYPTMNRALNITGSTLLALNIVANILFRLIRIRALRKANAMIKLELNNRVEPGEVQINFGRRGQELPHIPNWLFITYLILNTVFTIATLINVILL